MSGQVQGVGFRPFVYRLANARRLTGFVCNVATEAVIEVQGSKPDLESFGRALVREGPPLAVIHHLEWAVTRPVEQERSFRIEVSDAGRSPPAEVTPDAAVCGDCVGEMLDPTNRRYGHALISCTNCGPRFSIVRRAPYDRCNTTLASFVMCPACTQEYGDPADRRFHAQPICCHGCGPLLELVTPEGRRIHGDPIAETILRLNRGEIVAIKGLGGFHLAVRADDARAVGRLRQRKHRDAKPFAVMAGTLQAAQRLVTLSEDGSKLLQSPISPIVLAAAKSRRYLAENVAPGNHRLGVMLPNTPIQHLLFAGGRPALQPSVLVMTSGNLSDEPLVTDNDQAVKRLGGLCDAILWHDRAIERPVDDSVVLDMGEDLPLLPVRRARGYAPAAMQLPVSAAMPGLCVGGELKNTVAVVRADRVILSQHLGDLKHVEAYEAFQRAIDDLCRLFDNRPQWVAHDLHPAYLSTQFARAIAARLGATLIEVQHHHAHAAAVMAEHGLTQPVIGVICDGVGYGDDGSIWGGEVLLAGLDRFERLASLAPILLPGGDAAAKDTRRCAIGLMHQAFGNGFNAHPLVGALGLDRSEREMLAGMVNGRVNCVASSAAGRVFDGVAALLGVCRRNRFEAEAPISLEAAACGIDLPRSPSFFRIDRGDVARIAFAPLMMHLADGRLAGRPVPELAALFHDQFALGLAAAALEAAERTGVRTAVLSGGALCNERLARHVRRRLECGGMQVYQHERVPANDGGLALGQAAVAAARLHARE